MSVGPLRVQPGEHVEYRLRAVTRVHESGIGDHPRDLATLDEAQARMWHETLLADPNSRDVVLTRRTLTVSEWRPVGRAATPSDE